MAVIYMDNNATTRVADEVMEEMAPYFGELYGNPSSSHSIGGRAGKDLKRARKRVADALECSPEEIVFTACGTEGDNTAILSALAANPDKRHLVTTKVEHPAVLNLAMLMETRGYEVTLVDVDSLGRLDMAGLEKALRPDTALVSAMYANNETGVVFPVAEIAGMARERGILFHTDTVQTMGKLPLSMRRIPCDYAVLSGHKFHGPKGVGALFARKGAPLTPLLVGGGQEGGRRAGTENVPGIIGLGKAAELAAAEQATDSVRIKALRDKLERGLTAAIPDSIIVGDPNDRLPNTLSIAFKQVRSWELLGLLDKIGVCASSGSACHAGSQSVSYVLWAMGVPDEYAHGTLRLTLSRYNTMAEVDTVAAELPGMVAKLRGAS